MLKIEIASYPKSGNTWFRRITEEYIEKLEGKKLYPNDIHQKPDEVMNGEGAVYLNCIEDDVLIYKSHNHNHPRINPDKIIHIYRHPLDVFLSSKNYHYHTSSKMSEVKKNYLFKDGVPKDVDTIYQEGDLDFYFNDFMENIGLKYWAGMLDLNYFDYVFEAINSPKTITIKYEDLIEDSISTTNKVFNEVFELSDSNIIIDTNAINDKTKNGQNKKFFWKSKQKNYENYLSAEQIKSFENKFENQLKELGYL